MFGLFAFTAILMIGAAASGQELPSRLAATWSAVPLTSGRTAFDAVDKTKRATFVVQEIPFESSDRHYFQRLNLKNIVRARAQLMDAFGLRGYELLAADKDPRAQFMWHFHSTFTNFNGERIELHEWQLVGRNRLVTVTFRSLWGRPLPESESIRILDSVAIAYKGRLTAGGPSPLRALLGPARAAAEIAGATDAAVASELQARAGDDPFAGVEIGCTKEYLAENCSHIPAEKRCSPLDPSITGWLKDLGATGRGCFKGLFSALTETVESAWDLLKGTWSYVTDSAHRGQVNATIGIIVEELRKDPAGFVQKVASGLIKNLKQAAGDFLMCYDTEEKTKALCKIAAQFLVPAKVAYMLVGKVLPAAERAALRKIAEGAFEYVKPTKAAFATAEIKNDAVPIAAMSKLEKADEVAPGPFTTKTLSDTKAAPESFQKPADLSEKTVIRQGPEKTVVLPSKTAKISMAEDVAVAQGVKQPLQSFVKLTSEDQFTKFTRIEGNKLHIYNMGGHLATLETADDWAKMTVAQRRARVLEIANDQGGKSAKPASYLTSIEPTAQGLRPVGVNDSEFLQKAARNLDRKGAEVKTGNIEVLGYAQSRGFNDRVVLADQFNSPFKQAEARVVFEHEKAHVNMHREELQVRTGESPKASLWNGIRVINDKGTHGVYQQSYVLDEIRGNYAGLRGAQLEERKVAAAGGNVTESTARQYRAMSGYGGWDFVKRSRSMLQSANSTNLGQNMSLDRARSTVVIRNVRMPEGHFVDVTIPVNPNAIAQVKNRAEAEAFVRAQLRAAEKEVLAYEKRYLTRSGVHYGP